MRYVFITAGIGILLLSGTSWAQSPGEPATELSEVAETDETLEEQALEHGLTKQMVEKLSPDQLVEVLENQEIFRGTTGRELSEDIVAKLGPEQIAEVLKVQAESDAKRSSLHKVLIPILVPLFFFSCLGFLIGLPLYLRFRAHGQRQETLRIMVEKGVEIPADLISPPVTPKSDLQRGIVLLAAGVGLMLFLALTQIGQPGVWSLGLIPTLIGGGYLLAWKLEDKKIANG